MCGLFTSYVPMLIMPSNWEMQHLKCFELLQGYLRALDVLEVGVRLFARLSFVSPDIGLLQGYSQALDTGAAVLRLASDFANLSALRQIQDRATSSAATVI